MGLQCPDGAQKARAPALPGARVVALTSPSSSSHRSSFPPFHSKRQKKSNKQKNTTSFSRFSLTPSSPHHHRNCCSPALFFLFVFSCGSFAVVVVFCPLVSSTVCHVSATKQRNQSASRRAEGRVEGVGGGFLLLRRTEEPIYLFKCAAPQERFPVPPLLWLQNVDQCDCWARSHPRKNGG